MGIWHYDSAVGEQRIKPRYKYAFWAFIIGVGAGVVAAKVL